MEQKRQEQNIQVGIKSRQDRSVSRMDRGYLKSKAQMRAGQKKIMYDSRLEDNKEVLHELEPQIKRDVRYYVPHQTIQTQEVILTIPSIVSEFEKEKELEYVFSYDH